MKLRYCDGASFAGDSEDKVSGTLDHFPCCLNIEPPIRDLHIEIIWFHDRTHELCNWGLVMVSKNTVSLKVEGITL